MFYPQLVKILILTDFSSFVEEGLASPGVSTSTKPTAQTGILQLWPNPPRRPRQEMPAPRFAQIVYNPLRHCGGEVNK